MITVSTVIPVCNREQFVVKAIDSVASQTYPSTEIIVVDDASTDDTPRTVESLCRTFNNLSLIRLPKNVGAALARNIGARAAIIGSARRAVQHQVLHLPRRLRRGPAHHDLGAVRPVLRHRQAIPCPLRNAPAAARPTRMPLVPA